jgi:hypothetical protein
VVKQLEPAKAIKGFPRKKIPVLADKFRMLPKVMSTIGKGVSRV